jgi:IS605 OrfB family transposase
MKQTMLLKLVPTPQQAVALLDTLHAVNAACNYAGQVAFQTKTGNKFELQKLVYGTLRVDYGLPAQLAIRAISKTVEAYKRDRSIQPTFRPEGAIAFDERVMAFKGLTTVSLLTLQGRVLVPFRFGAHQRARLDAIQGQADLIYRKGCWYLAVTLDVPTPPAESVDATLGVDLGIVNLGTDSDGETCSGAAIEHTRQQMGMLKAALQQRGTKSAKRHLKKLSGRETRFRRDANHCISKHVVAKAKRSHKALALEDLRHIRRRTERTVRTSQRQRHASWAFAQLRAFIAYKAALAGVPVRYVDPRDTSRTCSRCGHCETANRVSQAEFLCRACGFAASADWNAAVNVARAAPSDSLLSRPVDRLDNQVVA